MPSKLELVYNDNDRVGQFIAQRVGYTWYPGMGTTIGVERNGELIAGFLYTQCTGTSCEFHIAALPGSRWCTRSILRVLFWYPFTQLGLKVLIGITPTTRTQVIHWGLRLGFTCNAIIPDAAPGGDLAIFTLRREDCHWV